MNISHMSPVWCKFRCVIWACFALVTACGGPSGPYEARDHVGPRDSAESPPGYCQCCTSCKVERGNKSCAAACDNCSETCHAMAAEWTCKGEVGPCWNDNVQTSCRNWKGEGASEQAARSDAIHTCEAWLNDNEDNIKWSCPSYAADDLTCSAK